MPKLLYLVTEDWAFWSHRLPMARAARAAGFEVVVATRVEHHRARIEAEGFRVHALDWRRRSNGALATLGAVLDITAIYRQEKPDIIHHVAMKSVIVGGLAAWLAGRSGVINALTGLGFVFIGESLLKLPVRALIRFVLRRPGSRLLLQNHDDAQFLVSHGFALATRLTVIRGSGIDIEHYAPLPEPATGPVTVAYVGRMLEDKGVPTLVEAHRLVRERGIDLRLVLVGTPDPENPTTVTEASLRDWTSRPGVEWRGAVADVRTVWRDAHFAVLPSRREGLPKSLLEAAACARALIATDVPGCREIARNGENAWLVPPDNPQALAVALESLATNAPLRAKYAALSRALVVSDLAALPVGEKTVALYHSVLAEHTR